VRKIDLTNFQVATSETARDINRRIVLNLIRSHQPISRADLARHSGLQRSTVSVIAEQLIDQRWITEGADGHTLRGRRPRFLHLNKERVGIIGVNIRPATTTVALADLDANFVSQESIRTAPNPEQFVEDLVPRLRNLIKMRPEITCEGIGVSLPGRVDLVSQRLVFAPNLAWSDFDLKTPIEQATGLPVELENAANSCALAEIWFGQQAEGVRNLVAVTVSEGIGCGLILNHQLVQGSSGMAGEFGHTTMVEDGLECRCGNRGCWELYASATSAAALYAGERASGGGEGLMRFVQIVARAEAGELRAQATLQRVGKYLGIGIGNLITGLGVSQVVVSGRIVHGWKFVHKSLREAVSATMAGRLSNWSVEQGQPTGAGLGGALEVAVEPYLTRLAGSTRVAA